MKDLDKEQLRKNFKKHILYALDKAKNCDITISFVFSGTHQGSKFRFKEKISCFGNNFTYKNVHLNMPTVDKDTAINIIVDNFYYDNFSYIECEEHFGKIECHGFGDYWGEDKFVFIYKRLNCI